MKVKPEYQWQQGQGRDGAPILQGRDEDAMQKPAWAKRLDAVNFTIIGLVMAVVVWETISRMLHR